MANNDDLLIPLRGPEHIYTNYHLKGTPTGKRLLLCGEPGLIDQSGLTNTQLQTFQFRRTKSNSAPR